MIQGLVERGVQIPPEAAEEFAQQGRLSAIESRGGPEDVLFPSQDVPGAGALNALETARGVVDEAVFGPTRTVKDIAQSELGLSQKGEQSDPQQVIQNVLNGRTNIAPEDLVKAQELAMFFAKQADALGEDTDEGKASAALAERLAQRLNQLGIEPFPRRIR